MDAIRNGRFTSSCIAALTSQGRTKGTIGEPFYTYVAEKNMERLLGRSLSTEVNAKPLSWGKLLECRVFDKLGIEYTLCSQETKEHPTLGHIWVGSADGMKHKDETAVTDIKCPITMKSFCQLVMPLYLGFEGIDIMSAIRFGFEHEGMKYSKHKEGDTYFYQLVSNAIINQVDYAELIVYMPYESELSEIKLLAEGNLSAGWIQWTGDNELPYLPDGSSFNNINVIRFKIPQYDIDFLTDRVKKAGELLIPIQQAKAA